MARRLAADVRRRPRLRLQVEHGLDARHARRTSQHDPVHRRYHHDTAHLRPALRVHRELHPAALPRRGRARQGLAAREDARRPLAEVREPARALRATCGRIPARSSSSWAASSRRSRSGATSGALDWHLLEHAGARRRPGARARPEPRLPRRAGALGARLRPGRLPLARGERRCRERRSRSRAARRRRRARRSSASCNLSPVVRDATTASACRAAARWREVLNTDSAAYGGSGRRQPAAASTAEAVPWHGQPWLGRADAAAARRRSGSCRSTAELRWRSGRDGRSRSARPGTARARTSRSSPSTPSASSSACSTTTAPRRGIELQRAHRAQLARLPPGRRARPALRLPRPRPVRTRTRAPLQPGEAADRPVREGDRGRRPLGRGRRPPVRARRAEDADLVPDDEDDAAAIPKCVVIDPRVRLGGRPAARDAVARDGDLRGAREGLHEAPPGVREDLRGTYAGLASTRRSPTCARSASPRSSCSRSTTSPTRSSCTTAGSRTTGATRSIGYFAPHALYAATGTRGEQVHEFKGMVKALHRAGIEVILDVVYNHTAEGNHLGPMLSFRGIDNRALLPARARRPAPLHRLHRHRQLAQPGAPERAAADHGLAALLGDRVPRRRLPLRPRLGARARVLRRRPALGVLRRDPPGPGALAGEADRRAVGPRARAATRSATSRCSGRSGTTTTATRCATSGAGEANVGDVRVALHRLERPLPATTAARRPRRSTSSPPTTASRSPTSSPTTRSTTRRTSRTTATAPTTTARGTAASRGRPTTRRCSRCARASSGTSSRRCSSRRACRCCSAATSSAARRAATTTRGARTTRSPGSTGSAADAGELLEFTRRLIALRREPPGLPADALPRRQAGDGGAARTRGGSGPTAGGWRSATGERRRRASSASS